MAGAVILVAGLTGCSVGGNPGSNADSGSGASSASAPSGGSGGGSTSSFVLPTTCLSQEDVSSVLGVPADAPSVHIDSESVDCEYVDANHDGPIVDIEPNSEGLTSANFVSTLTGGSSAAFTRVSGMGDAAALVGNAGARQLSVLVGKYILTVSGGSASDSALKALATKILTGE